MSEQHQHDARRKLSPEDYSKIRFDLSRNYTIREVASNYNISTKYAKRVAAGAFTFSPDGSVTFSAAIDEGRILPVMPTFPCSGCGFSYGSSSGLSVHMAIYTSGNTKELECATLIGR